MSTLRLTVRYFVDSTPKEVPCREENFVRRELQFALPLAETALVLVDPWNKHHIESWVQRADAMVRDVIAPILEEARLIGLPVVFAPSPEVLRSVPLKYRIYHGRTDRAGGASAAAGGAAPAAPPVPSWPPQEFIHRRGEAEQYRNPRMQYPDILIHWPAEPTFDISPRLSVREGDYVVENGSQLHDLCEERRIVHLLYAGFATNWCIINRDYGVVAMRSRGYNTMLLRDATEGVEFPDTLEERWATELAIREVEQRHGFSVSSESFFAACRRIREERGAHAARGSGEGR